MRGTAKNTILARRDMLTSAISRVRESVSAGESRDYERRSWAVRRIMISGLQLQAYISFKMQ